MTELEFLHSLVAAPSAQLIIIQRDGHTHLALFDVPVLAGAPWRDDRLGHIIGATVVRSLAVRHDPSIFFPLA